MNSSPPASPAPASTAASACGTRTIKGTPEYVDATVVGDVEFEPGAQQVKQLKLATTHATYQDRPFEVGVEAVP